jgi:hypothetical protein
MNHVVIAHYLTVCLKRWHIIGGRLWVQACYRLSDVALDVRVCHYKKVDAKVAADINDQFKLATVPSL